VTTFEYIAVLVSIVVGLGITHLLGGVGRLIGNPGRPKIYWVHIVWSFYLFVYLVAFWWWEFRLSTVEEWRIELYLFLVLYAVLMYLLCVIVFPMELPSDFDEYFYLKRGWFFGIWILIYLVDMVDTLSKGGAYFTSYGLEYPVTITAYVALSATAILTVSRRFHGAFAVGMCVYQFVWMFRLFGTVS
jgi:hypothetical protein